MGQGNMLSLQRSPAAVTLTSAVYFNVDSPANPQVQTRKWRPNSRSRLLSAMYINVL